MRMSEQDRWVRETLNYICPFAKREWVDHRQDLKVFVSAYRVYRVPLKGAFSLRPLVAEFGRVRAVFVQWDAPYQELYQNVIEQPNGQINMQLHHLPTHRTGDGVLLLLMTPLPENYDGNDEDDARDRVSFTRSIMVALIGRNAAYKHEFDINVECGDRSVANPSPVFSTPADETPKVNEEGVALISEALNRLSSFDGATQNRIRLALRWYQRAFGDDRLVRDVKEGQVDDFINCWLALETLVMEGTTIHSPNQSHAGRDTWPRRAASRQTFPRRQDLSFARHHLARRANTTLEGRANEVHDRCVRRPTSTRLESA